MTEKDLECGIQQPVFHLDGTKNLQYEQNIVRAVVPEDVQRFAVIQLRGRDTRGASELHEYEVPTEDPATTSTKVYKTAEHSREQARIRKRNSRSNESVYRRERERERSTLKEPSGTRKKAVKTSRNKQLDRTGKRRAEVHMFAKPSSIAPGAPTARRSEVRYQYILSHSIEHQEVHKFTHKMVQLPEGECCEGPILQVDRSNGETTLTRCNVESGDEHLKL